MDKLTKLMVAYCMAAQHEERCRIALRSTGHKAHLVALEIAADDTESAREDLNFARHEAGLLPV